MTYHHFKAKRADNTALIIFVLIAQNKYFVQYGEVVNVENAVFMV